MTIQPNQNLFDDEVKHVADEISGEFARHSRAHRELELSELDVAQFLATQLVVPILASFLSALLYDAYKDLKTKKQAQEAQETLSKQTAPPNLPVAKATVVKELSEKLTTSVESRAAVTIVSSCYERVERHFAAQQRG